MRIRRKRQHNVKSEVDCSKKVLSHFPQRGIIKSIPFLWVWDQASHRSAHYVLLLSNKKIYVETNVNFAEKMFLKKRLVMVLDLRVTSVAFYRLFLNCFGTLLATLLEFSVLKMHANISSIYMCMNCKGKMFMYCCLLCPLI